MSIADSYRFILLANRTTIHVYSTHTSLLTRSIKLKINTAVRPNAHIVTYCLSPTNSNLIWVACSDGTIYGIDWTTGAGADQSWSISSTGCIHMTVASMESGKRRRDVVFTTEMRKDGGWRITANELAQPKDPFETAARTIYTSNQRISFLKTANEGSVIVAASEKRVLIANLRSTEYNTIDKIRYEFRIFESPDLVSSLDLKVHARPNAESLGKSALRRLPVVDVVVGDARGSIFVHDDLLGNLARSQEEKHPPGISLIPRKLHWHRKEVCTVKWSLDGMCSHHLSDAVLTRQAIISFLVVPKLCLYFGSLTLARSNFYLTCLPPFKMSLYHLPGHHMAYSLATTPR